MKNYQFFSINRADFGWMLDNLKQLFVRTQKPPYQAGTNLLLVLVLSVVVGAGVSYGTLGFMKAFDSVLNWIYF
ncbi:uncharacterized protein METZ01_LOCUS219162, partial [marine metagenome]